MLRGLNIGSGVFLIGKREGDNANSFELPGYVRWDALVGYRWRTSKTELSLQLNVNNILDKTYYDASPAGATNIYPGIPRTFLGSIKIRSDLFDIWSLGFGRVRLAKAANTDHHFW